MLSILIPVFNTDVSELVFSIRNMAKTLNLVYEIRVADDASTDFQTRSKNQFLIGLQHCTHTQFEINRGRTATSQFLAEEARYNWLLFLDADVMPVNSYFLEKILSNLQNAQVIFGGIAYAEKIPEKNQMLRWVYGKNRESRLKNERELNPYKSITAAGLAITKNLYLDLKIPLTNLYGLDIYLTYQLKKLKAVVLHLENPVMHLGLEDSESYLQKTYEGLQTLVYLQRHDLIAEDYRPLQQIALKMQKTGVANGYIKLFHRIQKQVVKNLLSTKPSLKLFDAYRLYYFLKITKEDA
ncbi:glycosyltransferase [Leeuwenhoekiella sp. NPDC079379]|uniref:glycosyltransferase n=1 Tax=Leeuwenhoekiella sp. NPDC079379 TaxID=3364122 RepID=UPI0037CCB218